MRTLTINRRQGNLGDAVYCKIISDGKYIGEIKADENSKVTPISKGEHAIQCEVEGTDGRKYRSNSYFATGGKNVVLYLTISGTKLTLNLK